MTYNAYRGDFAAWLDGPGACHHPVAVDRRGIMRRLYHALLASRQRQADRDIARLLERSGGRITDAVEREMTRLALNPGRRFRD